jgi:hypothetical protein
LSWPRSRRWRWPSVALLLHCRIHVGVPPAVIAGWFCVLSVRRGNHNSSAPRWPARSSCRPCGSDLFVLGSSRSRTRGPAKVTWPGFTRSARGRNELSHSARQLGVWIRASGVDPTVPVVDLVSPTTVTVLLLVVQGIGICS